MRVLTVAFFTFTLATFAQSDRGTIAVLVEITGVEPSNEAPGESA